MDELIYRYALLEQIEKDSEGTLGSYGENWQFINTIRKMPTIERRPTGEWILEEQKSQKHIENIYICSVCRNFEAWGKTELYNFCPNCGADMRGKQDE